MIKNSKEINRVIDHYMKTSFGKNGDINSGEVERHVKALKTLPTPQSIVALSEYTRRIRTELQKTTLEIETAIPLSSGQIHQITQVLKAEHKISAVKSIVNPSILGGIKVKIGDVVYDDSVSRKILQLGENISE